MRKKLALYVFIDALGWEILQAHPKFLESLAPERKCLETILGYSSACDPSIISGRLPFQHRHWSSFYYSPHSCPYPWVKILRFLPKFLNSSSRVRYHLSKSLKFIHGFTGYFQIYHVPFEVLPLFDYAEKWNIWRPRGLNIGKNIFDYLKEHNYSHLVAEERDFHNLKDAVSSGSVDFAYQLFGGLDALMHAKGTKTPLITSLLEHYQEQIEGLYKAACCAYEDVSLYVFSDHGMHDVHGTFDIQEKIQALGLEFGHDFVAVYDSTMARFWFFSDLAKTQIVNLLGNLGVGRILDNEELKREGVYFPDSQFGEVIFLMEPHQLIIPSFMGLKPILGMHGYAPQDLSSKAAILSTKPLPGELRDIHQIFFTMMNEMNIPVPEDETWVRPLCLTASTTHP